MGWMKKGNLKGPKGDAGSIDWGEDVTIDAKKNVTLRFDAATSALKLAGDDKAYDSQGLAIDKSGFIISSGSASIIARKDGDISIAAGSPGEGTTYNSIRAGNSGVSINQVALVGGKAARSSLSMDTKKLAISCPEVTINGKKVMLEGEAAEGGGPKLLWSGSASGTLVRITTPGISGYKVIELTCDTSKTGRDFIGGSVFTILAGKTSEGWMSGYYYMMDARDRSFSPRIDIRADGDDACKVTTYDSFNPVTSFEVTQIRGIIKDA